jgi:Mlc titration factor MtfA (ptsG expression regulator)
MWRGSPEAVSPGPPHMKYAKLELMLGLRARRRRHLMERSLPAEWEATIRQRVPYSSCLPSDEQDRLRGLVQVFLDEKEYEGCGGLGITDEIRLTIAGHACILLLGGQSDMFPKLRSILVYPRAYVAPDTRRRPDGTVTEGFQGRSGESWSFGSIVLSWADVLRDSADVRGGRNVVFHEFAHQLDFESGSGQGAPILPRGAKYSDWARILAGEYESLIDSLEFGQPSLLDKYGALNPAEFFAVATEAFFLKPNDLAAKHPELYTQLKLYYRQDPVLYCP